jgi:hypothetical protein
VSAGRLEDQVAIVTGRGRIVNITMNHATTRPRRWTMPAGPLGDNR